MTNVFNQRKDGMGQRGSGRRLPDLTWCGQSLRAEARVRKGGRSCRALGVMLPQESKCYKGSKIGKKQWDTKCWAEGMDHPVSIK